MATVYDGHSAKRIKTEEVRATKLISDQLITIVYLRTATLISSKIILGIQIHVTLEDQTGDLG